jgi:hypothetical protein
VLALPLMSVFASTLLVCDGLRCPVAVSDLAMECERLWPGEGAGAGDDMISDHIVGMCQLEVGSFWCR